jgi:hypothetical protein
MKIFANIFFIIILSLIAGHRGIAQVKSVVADTMITGLKKTGSSENEKNQDIKNSDDKQPGKSGTNEGSSGIKHIKTARPDLSKVRGARPPDIIRPSGSRIPRGLGKPGGANIPGRK